MPLDRSGKLSHVRPCMAEPPKQPLSPPYELRPEMNWIDFSGASNPLGTPPSFVKAMEDALCAGELSYAPDQEAHAFRSVLSKEYGLPASSFLVGSSVSDMVHAVAQTFEPCSVGIPVPGHAEYALAAANAGHTVVQLTSPTGFVVPDPAFAKKSGADFNAAILANPSYPTSRLLSKPTLLSYLEVCDWVVVDERSIELSMGGESMVPLVTEHQNLVVVQSLCESYALSGIPISYCVAHPDTIAQIERFYDRSGVSMFAEVLGQVALDEKGHLEHAREFLETEIPWLQCMLSLIPGVSIFPAEANYVLCLFDPGCDLELDVKDTEELVAKLQLAGFLVRKMEDTPPLDDRYFCVAVRTRQDNERLIAAMREIVGGR